VKEHRVDELAVHVRAAAAPPPGAAEAFVRHVLDRAGDLVDAQFNGALVYVRRIAFARRLSPAALADPDAARALAEELGDDLAALAVVASPSDVPTADVLVFGGEAERRAAHLIRRVQAAPVAWWEEDLSAADETGVLGEGPLLAAVLAALGGTDRLEEVLARASPAFLEHAERALEQAAGAAIVAGIDEHIAPTAMRSAATSMAPSIAWRARRLARALRALAALATGGSSVARFDVADPAVGPVRVDAPAPQRGSPAQARPLEESGPVVVPTGYSGLFFLVNLVLELEAAEILYKACLDERVLLARALAALVPDETDPAPELAAGASASAAMMPVTPEQAREAAGAMLEALLRALPRRGLAALPEVRLDLQGAGAARLVVARPTTGACALFAWPAPSPQAVAAALGAFLARWPRAAGRLAAAPALAEIEPERLLASPVPAEGPRSWAPAASDHCAGAVVMQLAGAVTLLALARIDGTAPALPATLTAHLAIPGEVVDSGETRTVRMPADGVALAVRRAGLDRDPGWVPWLQRLVRFEYAGVNEA
jgi:hypothetical protein